MATADAAPKVVWGPCCFCGMQIADSDVDPCRITVETSQKKWQLWFCHAACFKSRVIQDSKIDLSPAHF
jgi:hypothetical protein